MERAQSKILICLMDEKSLDSVVGFATRYATKHPHGVTLLHAIEPGEYSGMLGVGDIMAEEMREQAEEEMQRVATAIQEKTHTYPAIILKEGKWGSKIIESVNEDSDIAMVVICVSQENERCERLAAWLAREMGDDLLVPVMLLPANLTDQQLDALV